MTAIDHQGYPHIFDAIIAHCDTDTLMRLRGTSRAYKQRVDGMLFTLVAYGRDKHGHFFFDHKARRRRPFAPSGVRALSISRWIAVDKIPMRCLGFTSLHTLRREGEAATDRRTLRLGEPTVVVDRYREWSDEPGKQQTYYLPPSTRRYVLYLRVRDGRPLALKIHHGAARVRDFVLVFLGEKAPALLAPVLAVAVQFAHVLASPEEGEGSITIVNLGRLQAEPTFTTTTRGPNPLTLLRDSLYAALVHRLGVDSQTAKAALKAVRGISRFEWEAELGAERALAETGSLFSMD